MERYESFRLNEKEGLGGTHLKRVVRGASVSNVAVHILRGNISFCTIEQTVNRFTRIGVQRQSHNHLLEEDLDKQRQMNKH